MALSVRAVAASALADLHRRQGYSNIVLDEMLEHIADGYEHDAEVAIQRLVAMIEPVMIVIMGVVIGAILLGIMMPMWSMYEYIV